MFSTKQKIILSISLASIAALLLISVLLDRGVNDRPPTTDGHNLATPAVTPQDQQQQNTLELPVIEDNLSF